MLPRLRARGDYGKSTSGWFLFDPVIIRFVPTAECAGDCRVQPFSNGRKEILNGRGQSGRAQGHYQPAITKTPYQLKSPYCRRFRFGAVMTLSACSPFTEIVGNRKNVRQARGPLGRPIRCGQGAGAGQARAPLRHRKNCAERF
jgi:hypothetical protein